jgi:hypothetical protein
MTLVHVAVAIMLAYGVVLDVLRVAWLPDHPTPLLAITRAIGVFLFYSTLLALLLAGGFFR